MTWDEWNAELATRPATPEQVGALAGQFRRLGLEHDRPRRLAVCAAMLGRDGLASTRGLSQGEAGQLIRLLGGHASAASLPGDPGSTPERFTLPAEWLSMATARGYPGALRSLALAVARAVTSPGSGLLRPADGKGSPHVLPL